MSAKSSRSGSPAALLLSAHVRRTTGSYFGEIDRVLCPLPVNRAALPRLVQKLGRQPQASFAASASGRLVRAAAADRRKGQRPLPIGADTQPGGLARILVLAITSLRTLTGEPSVFRDRWTPTDEGDPAQIHRNRKGRCREDVARKDDQASHEASFCLEALRQAFR